MSHYSVAVISRTGTEEEVENLLAPFDENIEVEKYIYRTKEQIIADGRERHEEALERIQKFEKDELIEILTSSSYDWYRQILTAQTSQDFYDIEVDTDMIDEEGNEYSTYNPESRWDWYQIGGRWSNSLKDKICNLWCDTCKIRNIDWDAEDEERHPFTSTYAVLFPNGEWRAPGEMGWWGFSSESDEEWDKWHENYKTMLLNATNPNWYITIVDCHI